ncbi:hypothetical protein [Pseudomonas sp. SBB6]|uniref:hypothetical protein n=1 Tax=Pseudomonas sp. SBB6 TaxID=2962032 RepID=UPI0020B69EE6|nr:hypothetical protein [Pseudomonas sp. SBB6]MCP3751453.1 hypothetical protein [Pseudomonas sp. SBB6]
MAAVLWVVTVVVVVLFATYKEMAESPGSEKALRWTLGIGVAAIGAILWAAYYYYGERPESEVKVSESVFSSYPKEQYPTIYKAWGERGVQQIKRVERLAAVKAARQIRCDNVHSIGLSEKHSRPTDRIVVFADCENGSRFYIDHSLLIWNVRKP